PPPRPRRTRTLVLGAVLAALVATGAALFTVRPWDDDGRASSTDRGDQAAGAADGSNIVPGAFLGTWEGEVKERGRGTGAESWVLARVEITRGGYNAPVATFVSVGQEALCIGDSTMESGGTHKDGREEITLSRGRLKHSAPPGACIELPRHELTTRNDGDLDWRTQDGKYSARFRPVPPGNTRVPSAYVGIWTDKGNRSPDNLRITITGGRVGVTRARTASDPQSGTHCEWTATLASVGAERLVFGPYELDAERSDGDCDKTGPVHTYTSQAEGKLQLEFPTRDGEFPIDLVPVAGD
ncbi:hypothetical protein U9R90_36085, partial [Streptomyces sp. E11-3]